MKAILVFLLKLTLTALCLWWAFSNVEIHHSVFTRPGAVDFGWLAAGLGFAGLSVLLQALRWWCFLRGQSLRVGVGRAVELTMIDGLFSLASVSGLGGSAARIILLMRDHPARKLAIVMSVAADHLAGLVAIALLFFLISVPDFGALSDPSVLGRGVVRFAWFYLGGGLALVMMVFLFASPPVHRRIHAGGRFDRWPLLKRVPEAYDEYRRNWRHALAGLGFSFAMLLAFFTSYYCGLRAVGGTLAYSQVLSAMPVIDAISGLPTSVAGVGVREKLFQVLLFDLGGVSAETAVAASLAGFACNMFWALLGAMFFLRKQDRIRRRDFAEARVVPESPDAGRPPEPSDPKSSPIRSCSPPTPISRSTAALVGASSPRGCLEKVRPCPHSNAPSSTRTSTTWDRLTRDAGRPCREGACAPERGHSARWR